MSFEEQTTNVVNLVEMESQSHLILRVDGEMKMGEVKTGEVNLILKFTSSSE